MISRAGNVRTGRAKRVAAFVLPAVCALLGASGVTAKPVLGMRELRGEVETARQRATACAALRERATRFESAGGLHAVDAAIASVKAVLPEALRPIDIHALVTLCFERRGIEIDSLAVLERRDSRHATLAEAVAETPVDVRGRARLSELASVVGDLRKAGLPAAVVEFSITRQDPASERFEFRLALALSQRVPATPTPAPEGGGEESS